MGERISKSIEGRAGRRCSSSLLRWRRRSTVFREICQSSGSAIDNLVVYMFNRVFYTKDIYNLSKKAVAI